MTNKLARGQLNLLPAIEIRHVSIAGSHRWNTFCHICEAGAGITFHKESNAHRWSTIHETRFHLNDAA